MKNIIYFALLLTLGFVQCAYSGSTNTKKSTGNVIEYNASTANDYLRAMILSSNFPFPNDIPKNKIQVEIDSQENETYLCRVYFETNGTGTLGWIKYDFVDKKLYNVTGECPVELNFDIDWVNKLNKSLDEISGNNFKPQNSISETKDRSGEKCSILPFDFDKYFEEYLSKGWDEISEDDKIKYCEYNFDENSELQELFSSRWEYTPSVYMILDKKENFILYFFRASKQEENDTVLISILATVKGNTIISSLNLNDFDTANTSSTFDISKELVVSIYKTLTKETGEVDDNGPLFITRRDSLIKQYVVGLDGNLHLVVHQDRYEKR